MVGIVRTCGCHFSENAGSEISEKIMKMCWENLDKTEGSGDQGVGLNISLSPDIVKLYLFGVWNIEVMIQPCEFDQNVCSYLL